MVNRKKATRKGNAKTTTKPAKKAPPAWRPSVERAAIAKQVIRVAARDGLTAAVRLDMEIRYDRKVTDADVAEELRSLALRQFMSDNCGLIDLASHG